MQTQEILPDLSLLASAIASKKINIVSGSSSVAHSDGQTVFLANTGQLDQNIYFTVIAQSLLLAGASFDKKTLKELRKNPQIIDRFLIVELNRLSTLYVDRTPRFFRKKFSNLSTDCITHSAEQSLQIALSRKKLPPLPKAAGTIKPRLLIKYIGSNPGGVPLSPEEIEKLLKSNPVISDNKNTNENEDSTPNSNTKLSGSGDNALSNYLKNMLGNESTPDTDDSGGSIGEISSGSARFIEKLRAGAKVISKNLLFDIQHTSEDSVSNCGISYPEWDSNKEKYRQNWCHINQYDPSTSSVLEDTPQASDIRLKRQLARLGMKYERYGRQLDGADLDTSALVELAVDKATGNPGDDRIYETHKKTGRDLSVIVLLDTSGSTEEQSTKGTSIWSKQRTLTLNLIEALDSIGDSVAAYGFRSYGRSDVRFLRIKQFDKRLNENARKRLMALEPSGYTRLGAAVRHATHIVKNEAGTTNQLLILISDGLPYDIEYSDSYAEQDARKALQEAVNSGVGCVCLTSGSSTAADVIERVWGHVGHANLPDITKLSQEITPLFKAALQQAARRPPPQD